MTTTTKGPSLRQVVAGEALLTGTMATMPCQLERVLKEETQRGHQRARVTGGLGTMTTIRARRMAAKGEI
jgi:hypothetical protein